jgi:hypothetical protein
MSFLDSIFGKSGSVLEKDGLGNYKADFWSPEQWREGTEKFGVNVGSNGELLDKNGVAMNIKELPAKEGLGGLFKEGGLVSQIGAGAKTGLGLLNLYSMGQDLFGSGRRDRKDAKDKMNRAFEQNYAMNDAAYKKFQDDLSIFRTGQANAKKSFETGSVDKPVKFG